MVIVNAMAAFKPKVVVGNIPPGVTKEEVAILLESHIGGGVAKENDPDTSQNSGKLLLIMASEDAESAALKLHSFRVRGRMLLIYAYTDDWKVPKKTTYSESCSSSDIPEEILNINLSLIDAGMQSYLQQEDNIRERFASSSFISDQDEEGKYTKTIPVGEEKAQFIRLLLDEFTKLKRCQIKLDGSDIHLSGNKDDVDQTYDHALEVQAKMILVPRNDYSSAGSQKIYQSVNDIINYKIKQKDLSAYLGFKDNAFLIMAVDEGNLKKATDIFDNMISKEEIPLSEPMVHTTKATSWTAKIASIHNEAVHIEVNEIDGSSHVLIEGNKDNVVIIKDDLQRWLKENTMSVKKVFLSSPVRRLLEKRVKGEMVTHLTRLDGSPPKLTFGSVGSKHYVEIEGSADIVQTLSVALDNNGDKVIKKTSLEIAKAGIDIALFARPPGRDRLDRIEIEKKCAIEAIPGKEMIEEKEKEIPFDFTNISMQTQTWDDSPKATEKKMVKAARDRKLETKPLPPPPKLLVVQGNLIERQDDVLVCTISSGRKDQKELTKLGILGKVFVDAGEDELIKGFEELLVDGRLPLGKANITSKVGKLKCKHIIFLTLRPFNPSRQSPDELEKVVEVMICKCLDAAKETRATSIAFPTIGCGQTKFPASLVAQGFKSTVPAWIDSKYPYDMKVTIVSHEDKLRAEFEGVFLQTEIAEPPLLDMSFSPRGGMSIGGIAKRSIILQLYAIKDEALNQAKSDLEKIIPTVLNQKIIEDGAFADIDASEKLKFQDLKVNGSHIELGDKCATITGDEIAVDKAERLVRELLKEVYIRIRHPDYIREHGGTVRLLTELSKSKDIVPAYWKQYGKVKTLAKGKAGDFLKDADTKTKLAVEELVMKTWKSEHVGRGADARGLTHTDIKITKVEVNANAKLYEQYNSFFKKTCGSVADQEARVVKIDGLDGEKDVWTSSLAIKHLDALRTPEINEVFLFHGTPPDRKKAIIKDGLDFRVANRALYGKGVYFAESSTKADQYADRGDRKEGKHYMLVCRVILRDPHIAKTALTSIGRPPCNDEGCKNSLCLSGHAFHDSVIGVGHEKTPRMLFREFVIYDKAQCFPEFVVEYERIAPKTNPPSGAS